MVTDTVELDRILAKIKEKGDGEPEHLGGWVPAVVDAEVQGRPGGKEYATRSGPRDPNTPLLSSPRDS